MKTPTPPGTLVEKKTYKACCSGCKKLQQLALCKTKKEARAKLREDYDWSLGRDKKWRCSICRPRRFGEGNRF